MPAEAIERLEAALGEAAGAEVVLERPGDAAHGDYATNVAMRLAGARKQPPRAIAEELVELAAALPDVERAEIAGPGFVNLWLDARVVPRRARRDPRGRRGLRRRLGGGQGERAGRDGLGQPDGADRRLRRAQRRLRRLRRAAARVRRARRRARVLLQRRRRADGALPRLGRGAPARGGAARGRLPGRLHRRARDAAGRPGAADAAPDRGDAGALPDPLRLLGECRASSRSGSPSTCRGWTPTRRTGPSGRARRRTATRTTAS